MNAPGSTAAQVALLFMLSRYERLQRIADWFPNVECAWKDAGRAHDDLLRAALLCGFAPGRADSHLSTLEWCQRRAELICRTLPNNAADAQRRAA